MAGTAYAGFVDNANIALSNLGLLIGQNRGTAPFPSNWNTTSDPSLIAEVGGLLIGTRVADTETDGFATADVAHPGALDDRLGGGDHWYEDLHVLPRLPIAFSNIITQQEAEYEVYNAYRSTDITITTVDAGAVQPGIELPEGTPSYVIEASTSQFNSATTANSAGTGLGTIVKLKLEAGQDGLPSFDGVITISGGGETVSLRVSGQRIVLIPMIYESPLREELEWATDLMESIDGREQRVALRAHPRAKFRVRYLLDGEDRQRMLVLLFDHSDSTFGFPLWHERVTLTSAASVGTTVYQISGGDEIDLRAGGLAVVLSSNGTFDVINVGSFTATTITANDPSLNSYPIGTPIMPLRTAVLSRMTRGKQSRNVLEAFDVEFEVTDNDTGAVAGSSTPGWWNTYNSRVLFDDCNITDGSEMPTEYPRRIYRIDSVAGVISQSSPWDRAKRGSRKGFFLKSRSEVYTFRQLLTALRGRQKAVYLPTFSEDLTAVADLTIGAATIDIVAIEYVRHALSRVGMNLFKITFTDDTSLIREIQTATTVSTTVERLTLDDTWPAGRTVAEISRIQFYELVRFDTDRITITHERIGRARSSVPVVRVFDDNP